jgi:hypothetical protein
MEQMPALSTILGNARGLNANHPQFQPPPAILTAFLAKNKEALNQKVVATGRPPLTQIIDLSGNVIEIPQ